jgi:hypothetical protein
MGLRPTREKGRQEKGRQEGVKDFSRPRVSPLSIVALGREDVCPDSDWSYDDTPAAFDGGPFPSGSKHATEPPKSAYKDALT